MKILFILDSLNRGGAEMLALDVMKNASAHRLDVSLVTTSGGDLEKEFLATGQKVSFIERKLPLDPGMIWQLRKLIISDKITHIHSHQAVDALHAIIATLGTNVRNILSWHGSPTDKKNIFILQLLYRKVDANIAVSYGFKQRIAKEINIDTKNFSVVYNGVDPNKLKVTNSSLRKELNLSANDILFGMVGNFYFEARDQFTVCKALPELFKKFPNARFVFVGNRSAGNPHLFDRCKEFCQQNNITEKVFFLQARSDISNILKSLDVFVFSSISDTFGIAVVEAMMAGVPCICSDIEPLLEITGNGQYGLLFKTGDEKELANRMMELAEKQEVREKLSYLGSKWALEKFNINEHICNLKKVYNKVCVE